MKNKFLGLYLHIPFCVKKCAYCDFLSFPADDFVKRAYTRALIREIETVGREMKGRGADTVFIGGGTPTALPTDCLRDIFKALQDHFNILENAEITMEMNPGTDREELDDVIGNYVNRISLGLQSMNDKELEMLGRIHRRDDFLKSYEHVRRLGIQNINIDLMSALPGQNLKSWLKTLTEVTTLQSQHISAYSLIIEEGTPFYELNQKKALALPDEDSEREMYEQTENVLKKAGYHRYEISNYAKNGYESRHNKKYWTGDDYLGLGLGASSLLNEERWHNTADMADYIKESGNTEILREDVQKLTRKDQMEEFMFLGLRLMKGVSLTEFKERFGKSMEEVYGSVLKKLIGQNLLIKEKDRIALTKRGIDVSNQVMSEFLF